MVGQGCNKVNHYRKIYLKGGGLWITGPAARNRRPARTHIRPTRTHTRAHVPQQKSGLQAPPTATRRRDCCAPLPDGALSFRQAGLQRHHAPADPAAMCHRPEVRAGSADGKAFFPNDFRSSVWFEEMPRAGSHGLIVSTNICSPWRYSKIKITVAVRTPIM